MAISQDKIGGKKWASKKHFNTFIPIKTLKTQSHKIDIYPLWILSISYTTVELCGKQGTAVFVLLSTAQKIKRKWECLGRAHTSILLLPLKFEHCLLSYVDSWRQSLCFNPAKLPTFSAISALLVEIQNSLIVIAHLVRWTKNLLTDISLSVKKMQFTQNIDTLLKWEHMLIIMWSLLEIIDNRKAIIFNVLLRLWNDNHCSKGPKMIDGLSFGAYTWHKLLDIYSFFL